MPGPFRIEGYAIVSADGMIADATGLMPNSLKIEADQRLYAEALDRVTVVAHGRLSHEGQPKSPSRRRLILTRRVGALATDPDNPNARFWNPAGADVRRGVRGPRLPGRHGGGRRGYGRLQPFSEVRLR